MDRWECWKEQTRSRCVWIPEHFSSSCLADPLIISAALLPVSSSDGCSQKSPPQPDAGDFDNVPSKRRKQLLSAVVALGAMLGYALLTGIVSIQHVQQEALEEPPDLEDMGSHEEEGDG